MTELFNAAVLRSGYEMTEREVGIAKLFYAEGYEDASFVDLETCW